MVTGDDVAIARQIAGELGLGVNIQLATDLFTGDVTKTGISPDIAAHIDAADGFARVFPERRPAQEVRAESAAGAVAEQDAVFGGESHGAGNHRVRRKRW